MPFQQFTCYLHHFGRAHCSVHCGVHCACTVKTHTSAYYTQPPLQLLRAPLYCICLELGELVCPQLEHSCEPWCFAAACALASLCARSWNTLVSLGALPLLAPWRACVPAVGTFLWALVLCRCLRLGKLVCPQLEHSCEPWCFAAACALASLCARSWNILVSPGALPLLAPWQACVPAVGTLLWALVLCRCLRLGELVCPQLEHPCAWRACVPAVGTPLWALVLCCACCLPLASLCARSWNTLVSLGALLCLLFGPWRACVPAVGTPLWALVLCCACCSLPLGELVCPQLEHPCEPWCFAVLALWPLASLCARSWNTLVSLGALLCLLFGPWRACVPAVGTPLWALVLCCACCLALCELVCPQLEHPCEPWCFAVLVALCPLASLCARSWNTLVSLGALLCLLLFAPWRACVPAVGTPLWALVLCALASLCASVIGTFLWALGFWSGCCSFSTEFCLSNMGNLLAAQDGSATNKLGHHTTWSLGEKNTAGVSGVWSLFSVGSLQQFFFVASRRPRRQSRSMSCELTLPTRRLRRKTWLGFHVVAETEEAGPLPQHDTSAFVDADFAEEVTGSVKSVYLVTLPALRSGVASRGHVCPSTWSHDEVLRVFLAVFHCDQDSGSESRFQLELMTVFRERHVAGPYHALKAAFALPRTNVLSMWDMAWPPTGVAPTRGIGLLCGMGSCRLPKRNKASLTQTPWLGPGQGPIHLSSKLRKSQWRLQLWRAGARRRWRMPLQLERLSPGQRKWTSTLSSSRTASGTLQMTTMQRQGSLHFSRCMAHQHSLLLPLRIARSLLPW